MDEVVIDVVNIFKNFKNIPALKGVSFKVKRNTIFGLLGSNGAGKTTMLHILTGLLKSSRGNVSIFGKDIGKFSKELKEKVAIVPQKISLYEDLTIYENLYFFANTYNLTKDEIKNRINKLANILNLGDLKKKIKVLSGGYKRRVSLAVGLIGDPEILILDEAMVGIDLQTKKIITELLIEIKKKITIIITTHSIGDAEELCDEVCFLHVGERVIYGKTRDIVKDYSKDHGSKVILYFKKIEYAESFLKDRVYKNMESEGRKIIIKFFPSKRNAYEIINFIKKNEKYSNLIEDIEVKKPDLEDVMLNLISIK